jgi:type I restriction enzyme S subunit
MISRNFFTDIYPIKFLCEVVEFLDSKRRPVTESDRRAGNYPYYGANGQQGTIDDYIFDEPLVLLAEDGGHFGNPERGIAYQISGKTWVNNHAHVLRPKENIDLAFLCRVLENYDVTPFVTGTTRGKLTQAGAAGIPIPIPPIAEQKRIAEILDRTQSLISKRKGAIAKFDTLTQSIFLEMFGSIVNAAERFPSAQLSDVTKFIDYRGISPNKQSSGLRLVTARNIKRGWFENEPQEFIPVSEYDSWMRRGIPRTGDVLFTTEGHTLGSAAKLPHFDKVALAQRLIALQPKESICSDYLLQVILTKTFQADILQRSTGSAARGISSKQLAQIALPLPPISLQQEFAQRVEAVEKLKAIHHASLSELEALFASLQHRAFRGEL